MPTREAASENNTKKGKLDEFHWLNFFFPGDHVTHLENVSEEEMNRLLGIVLDVEYLYTCIHKEEDADTKQVYFSLFKVILLLYTRFEAR